MLQHIEFVAVGLNAEEKQRVQRMSEYTDYSLITKVGMCLQ